MTTDFGGTDIANAVVLQSDGKIVAVGQDSSDFALARYNADGSLDSSFGTGGKVTTDFGGSDAALAAVLQPDGKIVAVGTSAADFALARYNTDGSLDTSFGTGGKVTTDFGGTDQAWAAVLQPDGKIVAAGLASADFALARYNTNGSLDTSFGTGGKVTTSFEGSDQARAVVLQPDGKIVAVGWDNGVEFALARYNTDGLLDSSFGTGGKVTTDFGGSDAALAAVLQSDGKIVAVGFANTTDFALARYLIPSLEISSLARDLRAKYFLLQ